MCMLNSSKKVEDVQSKYDDRIADLKDRFSAELHTANMQHDKDIATLEKKYDDKIKEIKSVIIKVGLLVVSAWGGLTWYFINNHVLNNIK